jgi:cystathionine gamma-lyase
MVPGNHKGYEYARTQNPTRTALQENLAALENGTDAICFGSGLAAMDAIIKLLKSGDGVIASNDMYGGSFRLLEKIFKPFGISNKLVPMQDP